MKKIIYKKAFYTHIHTYLKKFLFLSSPHGIIMESRRRRLVSCSGIGTRSVHEVTRLFYLPNAPKVLGSPPEFSLHIHNVICIHVFLDIPPYITHNNYYNRKKKVLVPSSVVYTTLPLTVK